MVDDVSVERFQDYYYRLAGLYSLAGAVSSEESHPQITQILWNLWMALANRFWLLTIQSPRLYNRRNRMP